MSRTKKWGVAGDISTVAGVQILVVLSSNPGILFFLKTLLRVIILKNGKKG